MALLAQHLQRFLLTKLHSSSPSRPRTNVLSIAPSRKCSAIAIDAPTSLTDVVGIRWGSIALQGARDEMEDDVVVRSCALDGFSFAAVLDGHAGSSSIQFLREELCKECAASLRGGLVLNGNDFKAIQDAFTEAFEKVDRKLLNWLEASNKDDESGSTATVIVIGSEMLFISHIGDSSVVISRTGKAEELTAPHRPCGSDKTSLQEIRRIREAGGWIVNGRICGDIAVSRAFGDIRFKTKKNEMLRKGVEEGRWPKKFASRVQLKQDLIIASPDVFQVPLGSDAEFIILASDGLWDYMSSSDAVSLVRNELRQHGDVQIACETLARAALDRHSQDNISIILADLGQTDWQNLPIQQQSILIEFAQALATVSVVTLGIWMSSLLSW